MKKKSGFFNKVLRWQHGRQSSGYDKMLLLTGMYPIPFDFYLLRFPEGSEIPKHVDNVENGDHYRVNVIIQKPKEGGVFSCDKVIYASDRIKYFRPDKVQHSVSKITKGSRLVLSLGWIRNYKR